jgi:2',3'-cyclic-nucleotide 2'-phosphodiesterase/3'-nucleotidase/5'-nucleotidase
MTRRVVITLFVSLIALPVLADRQISLQPIGKYATGVINLGATEIAAFDPASNRLFSINGASNAVDVIDLTDPTAPQLITSLLIAGCAPGGLPTSVAVREGIVAVAAENPIDANPGWVAFFDTAGDCSSFVTVGAGPDMVAFTHNGRRVLVANEGEAGVGGDAAGSVAIIDMTGGVTNLTQADVTLVTFETFNKATIDPRIHRINPSALVPLSIDLEPEYLAVSHDSKTAWVTLQENNALAVLDIEAARFTSLLALGFKNHNGPGNPLDPSDQDGGIHRGNWPVLGMYQPDGIAAVAYRGETLLITANEGDSRGSEETRVGSVTLDPTAFPNAATLQANANLGRLRITNLRGDTDSDGDFDQLYAFGGRSFSIWTAAGQLVFDSGEAFEGITALAVPQLFNSNGDSAATFDTRSDDKGPEPEGVAVGHLFGRTYAFIGLERTGGIMVFDITNPVAPIFVQYKNNHTIGTSIAQGDVFPEGLLLVKADDSPTGNPLLIVSHEISGTITIYEIQKTGSTAIRAVARPLSARSH